MKSPEEWLSANSQSGPFDLVSECGMAEELIEAIQKDAIASVGAGNAVPAPAVDPYWCVVFQIGKGFMSITGRGSCSEKLEGFQADNAWITENAPPEVLEKMRYKMASSTGAIFKIPIL